MDDIERVAFSEVEVLAANPLLLLCRVKGRVVSIPPRRVLPGTTIYESGDRGTLVLTRDLAKMLGLV